MMKKAIFVYLLLLCSFAVSAQSSADFGDLFFQGSLAEAKAKAKAENRQVLIICSTSYCGPCKELARELYPTPEFRQFRDSNELIILYYPEIDKTDPDNVDATYNIEAVPAFVFLGSDGKEFTRFVGARSRATLEDLKACLLADNSYAARKKRLEEDPSTAYDFVQYLLTTFMNDEMEKTIYDLLKKGPLEDYFTEKWWEFYKGYAMFIDSGVIRFMVDYPDEVIAVIGKEKYDEFMYDRGIRMISTRVSGSHKYFDKVRQIVEFIDKHPQLETPLSRFFKKNIDIVENGSGEEVFDVCMKGVKKADTPTREALMNVAWYKLTSLDRKELEENYMKPFLEKCVKYEKDEKAKEMYSKTLEMMEKRLDV